MSHEKAGKSDEWYTPKYIFDAMEVKFDMDVASPIDRTYCSVPAKHFITENSLELEWNGFVWMNPPYGNQKVKFEWGKKLIEHGNGVCIMPDRTSAPWWQYYAKNATAKLHIAGKVKFIDQYGNPGESPSNGSTLFGFGVDGHIAIVNAERNGLGIQ